MTIKQITDPEQMYALADAGLLYLSCPTIVDHIVRGRDEVLPWVASFVYYINLEA